MPRQGTVFAKGKERTRLKSGRSRCFSLRGRSGSVGRGRGQSRSGRHRSFGPTFLSGVVGPEEENESNHEESAFARDLRGGRAIADLVSSAALLRPARVSAAICNGRVGSVGPAEDKGNESGD
jgi:hypothetical protein